MLRWFRCRIFQKRGGRPLRRGPCALREIRLSRVGGVFLIGGGFAVLCVLLISARMSPLISAIAVDEINNRIHRIVNDAVNSVVQEQMVQYDDLVILERDETGLVTSASSNIPVVNLLRTELVARILASVEGVDQTELAIPLGNLTGVDLLSGRGPSLRVTALSVGTIQVTMEHSFIEAGVNQTLHRIYLCVDVPAMVLLPTGRLETQVATELCVAENIIVGAVPNTYIQLESQQGG